MDEERTTSGPDSPGTTPSAPKKTARKAVKKAAGQTPARAAVGPAPSERAVVKRAQPAKTRPAKASAEKAEPAKAQVTEAKPVKAAKAAAKKASAKKAQAKRAEPAKVTPTKAQITTAEAARDAPAKATAQKAPAQKAPAQKATAREAPARKAPAKSPAKKAPAKSPAKKAPARKAADSPAKTAAGKRASAPAVRETPAAETARGAAPAAREPAAPQPVRAPTQPKAVRDRAAIPPVPPKRPELTAWLDALTDLARHPDRPRSLERLAALAVAHIGPRAQAWTDWLRDTYPTAPPAGMARLAARRATTTGRRLAVLAATGPLGALLPLPAAEWARATLVLRIAAAYGHDPGDPRRVPELLDLLELRTNGGQEALRHAADRAGWRMGRLLAARLVFGRTRAAGAVRALLATADQDEEMERLAHRAMLHYRGSPGPPRQRTAADQGRFSLSRNSA
jgi:hypothetical protein